MRISDWSSDVCSSDLLAGLTGFSAAAAGAAERCGRLREASIASTLAFVPWPFAAGAAMTARIYSRIAGTGSYLPDKVLTHDDPSKIRSEERRGGKACVSTGRSRWSPDP